MRSLFSTLKNSQTIKTTEYKWLMKLSHAVWSVKCNSLTTEEVYLPCFLYDLISSLGVKEWQSTSNYELVSCLQLSWNHKDSKDRSMRLKVRSKMTDCNKWHRSNLYTWCRSYCTRWKLDLFPKAVPEVCTCQVVVYMHRAAPHWMQYWNESFSKCLFLSNTEMCLNKADYLCNCLLSCGFWIE